MEQQSSVNRLYWLNANGDWELMLEHEDDNAIILKAECLMQGTAYGVCGYAKYPKAPDYMRWTAYNRYAGGCSRRPNRTEDVPKPIRLLEMLNE